MRKRTPALAALCVALMSNGTFARAQEGDVVIVVDADGERGPTRATVVSIEGSEELQAPRAEDAPVVVIFPPGTQVHVRPHTPDASVPPPPAVAPHALPPAPAHALASLEAAAIEARIQELISQRPRIAPRVLLMSLGGVGAFFLWMATAATSWCFGGCRDELVVRGTFAGLFSATLVAATVWLFRGLKVRRRISREVRTLRRQLAISF